MLMLRRHITHVFFSVHVLLILMAVLFPNIHLLLPSHLFFTHERFNRSGDWKKVSFPYFSSKATAGRGRHFSVGEQQNVQQQTINYKQLRVWLWRQRHLLFQEWHIFGFLDPLSPPETCRLPDVSLLARSEQDGRWTRLWTETSTCLFLLIHLTAP